MKHYGFGGYSGCVVTRKARTTGALVSIYNNDQAGLDADGGPWSTVCEKHSWVVSHNNLKAAQSWLSHPEEWCEECMKTTPVGKDR